MQADSEQWSAALCFAKGPIERLFSYGNTCGDVAVLSFRPFVPSDSSRRIMDPCSLTLSAAKAEELQRMSGESR